MSEYPWSRGIAAVLLAMLWCGIASVQAQIPSQFMLARDTTFRSAHSLILLEGNGSIGSPVLDRDLMSKLFFGGAIADDHTDRLLSKMDRINQGGANALGQLSFYGMADTIGKNSDWGLQVKAASAIYSQIGFSDDLFELIFKGNGAHVGDSMELGPFSGEYQSWQKFGLGLFNKKTFSGVSLSLASGQDYRRMEVRNSSLFTSPLSDSLVLSYQGDFTRSDTSKSGWGSGSGLGFALDLDYNRFLAEGKGFISISLRDFGWIRWNGQTEHFTFDSGTTWKGFTSDDLINSTKDFTGDWEWSDSLDYAVERKARWRMLPFSVHLRMLRYFSANTLIDFAIRLQPGHYSLPLVQAGVSHFITKNLLISGRLGIGGYGRLSVGAEVQWMPRGKWFLRAGSNNLPGFVIPGARTTDAFVSVGRVFGRSKVVAP